MQSERRWHELLEEVSPEQRAILAGGSLSRRFSSMPLWLSHPTNIAGFYGLLIALGLIAPLFFTSSSSEREVWLDRWMLQTSVIIVFCMLLGMVSRFSAAIFNRLPMTPPRQWLYPMPFVGIALLTIDRTDLLAIHWFITWSLLLIPGPLYVHLSWAPRWRLLCMVEDDKDPFAGFEIKPSEEESSSGDEQIDQVVDEIAGEE